MNAPKDVQQQIIVMIKFLLTVVVALCVVGFPLDNSVRSQQRLVSVAGYVLYPNGRPAAGARIYRYRKDSRTGLQGGAISQADGSFSLHDLEVGVAYDICASKPEEGYLDPSGLPFGLSVGGKCHEIFVRAGRKPGEIRLKLGNKSGSLSGRLIVARTRRPIASGKATVYRPLKLERGVWVVVDQDSASWVPSAVAETDSSGTFHFSNLPEGNYFLKMEASGYQVRFFQNQSSPSMARPFYVRSGQTTTVETRLSR